MTLAQIELSADDLQHLCCALVYLHPKLVAEGKDEQGKLNGALYDRLKSKQVLARISEQLMCNKCKGDAPAGKMVLGVCSCGGLFCYRTELQR